MPYQQRTTSVWKTPSCFVVCLSDWVMCLRNCPTRVLHPSFFCTGLLKLPHPAELCRAVVALNGKSTLSVYLPNHPSTTFYSSRRRKCLPQKDERKLNHTNQLGNERATVRDGGTPYWQRGKGRREHERDSLVGKFGRGVALTAHVSN